MGAAAMKRVVTGATALLGSMLALAPVVAQLRGHGGPVRALAISADAATALSGSFDSSAIRWSLRRNAAEQVLRFHDGAVNAVAILRDGRLATAGEDSRIALWRAGEQKPDIVLEGHKGPVVSLAVSPDGMTLASASWDHTVRLWPLAAGSPRVLEGHQQNVNGVAFTPDGAALVSVGYDATMRIWPLQDSSAAPRIVTLAAPLNAVVVAPDGEIVVARADGTLSFLSPAGELRGKVDVSRTPIIALAQASDGERLAAASIQGAIAIVERKERKVARVLVGPGLPVWSAAFLPDNRTLLTGGADAVIRRWDTQTGEPIGALPIATANDPLAAYGNDPGARVYRACIACHTLHPDEGNRAGPTLHGIFGRRIASLPGYNFSEALKRLNIVWTPETVAKLFEVGPARYTPGTKMPEQHIGATDRDALIAFLKKATQ
jgi:cytochrome c